MASLAVGKGHLCFRTIDIIASRDGRDENICVRKSRSLTTSSVWSSCMQ